MSIDTSHLKYNPHPLKLRFSVHIENWWRGISDRKNTLKLFCQQLGIDYPPTPRKKYAFPEVYVIKSDWIQYLGKMRDKVIANHSTSYHNANKRVQLKIDELNGQITQHNQYLAAIKSELQTSQNRLKVERQKKDKNSLEVISLESSIANQKAKICNCQSEIEEVKKDQQVLQDILAGNKESWRKQVDIINSLTLQTAKKYSVYATKKVNQRLNYTNFDCNLPDYNEDIKSLIGE